MLTPPAKVDKFDLPTFVSTAARFLSTPTDDVPQLQSMSTRFLIPMLCVGAVAFACGPRAHNEASARQKKQSSTTALATTAPTVSQQGATKVARDQKAVVSAQLYVRATDSAVRFALHIVNTGKKRVELTFPSGQTYDFVVLDSVGREMWRWGSGRMFTQTLRNKLLAGGESLDLEETLTGSTLPPGRYTARALLTSENYPLVQHASFTISPTTLAQR